MILLEIFSVLAAVTALVYACLAAKSDHAQAKDGLSNVLNLSTQVELARSKADALDAEGRLRVMQQRQPEADVAFAGRNAQLKLVTQLEEALKHPEGTEVAKQVTVSRRALNRAITAGAFGTLSAGLGGWAGILGAQPQSDDKPSPEPTTTN